MVQAIGILQLSDLHFGPHSRYSGMDSTVLGRQFAAAIKTAVKELGWSGGLRYCLVTGDIAEGARPSEYKTALTFFKTLLGELGVPESCCLFVPGNHDVSWTATKKVVLDQDDEGFSDAERDERISRVKLQHFDSFLREFYGKPREQLAGVTTLGHGAYVYHFPDDQLSVAALNTCERESHLRQGGALGKQQAQALMNHWLHDDARKLLKVVALHHNPVATVPQAIAEMRDYIRAKLTDLKPDDLDHLLSDLAGFEGMELLKRVSSDCQVQLVLHGHHHASDRNAWPFGGTSAPGHTQVLSAGSWGLGSGKVPRDEPTTAQLLWIEPGKKSLRVALRVYEARARADGEVEPGTFTADAAKPKGDKLALSLPSGFAAARAGSRSKKAAAPKLAGRLPEFVSALRDRLSSRYHRWELSGLGAIQPGGAGRPIEVQLDDIYLPLRVGEGYDPDQRNRGFVLDVGKFLASQRPLVLRGVAGSGKTTWMRWMFRRLLADATALPLMIELRRLAAQWERTHAQGSARTLDDYLQCWVADSGVSGWQDQLGPLLSAQNGPRPVLLVDGWDELGPLGTELREKLVAFLKTYPRVLAVVSSRPYGESRPAHSDGFATLDLQPLSDSEIATFSAKFHSRVHGLGDDASRSADAAFLRALHGAPDALVLARTPLLLTMMLLISRDRPLPDKRHRLYQTCIDSLLSARPAHREREGAQLGPDQYRPDDSATRLRAVSALAYKAQTSGYTQGGTRAPIVRSWDEFASLLPGSWTTAQRHGFLAWLVGGAGILTDRADGTLNFAHLSFQEFLCAHYLDTNTEGEGRIKLCEQYKDNAAWWETLRLWAALVNDRAPSKLDPVLEHLVHADKSGFWLVGAMLADGVGARGWSIWKNQLHAHFHTEDALWWSLAESAWQVSRQEDRRSELVAAWPELLSRMHWLSVLWAERWWSAGERPQVRPPPVDPFAQAMSSGPAVAHSRALFAVSPTWPCEPLELILLRLHAGTRSALASQFQSALSLGASHGQLVALAGFMLRPPAKSEQNDHAAKRFAEVMMQYLPQNLAKNFAEPQAELLAQDIAQGLAQGLAQSFGQIAIDIDLDYAMYFIQDFASYSARYFAKYHAIDFEQPVARDLTRVLAWDFTWDIARDIAWSPRYYAMDPWLGLATHLGISGLHGWLADWATLELSACVGRSILGALMAHSQAASPLTVLFRTACQVALGKKESGTQLKSALQAYSGNPLWPALARHIARCSTKRDRTLLTAAIQHPAKYDPPLAWGLKYYCRGDLLLPDGSELTLDALCDELKLPHLPYLEAQPSYIEFSSSIRPQSPA